MMEGERFPVEYSQPIKLLEELVSKDAGNDVRKRDGYWSKLLDQRRGSHTVAKFYVRAGNEAPAEAHEQSEYLILTEGKARVVCIQKNKEFFLEAHTKESSIHIHPGHDHIFHAITDVWGILITVPNLEGFEEENE